MTKKTGKYYQCNKCKLIEFIPEGEFGLKTTQITAVYCPFCINKNHKYKMKELKDDN